MQGWIMAAQLLLGLSFLVFIHELGHYLAARAFGIRVDKFYLFFDSFGVRLFRFRWKGTEFGIGWLPIGGYCKIHGMVDESLDSKGYHTEPEPDEYRAKAAWKRLIVICAGVILNLICGIVIFSLQLLHTQERFLPTSEVNQHGITAGPYGKQIGLEDGDKILKVNGRELTRFEDVISAKSLMGVTFEVDRQGQLLDIVVPDSAYKALSKGFDDLLSPLNYPVVISQVIEGSSAQASLLAPSMQLIELEGCSNSHYGSFRQHIQQHPGDSLRSTWLYMGDTVTRTLHPDSNGRIGILAQSPYQGQAYRLKQAFYYGTRDAFQMIMVNAKGIGQMVTGKVAASESVQGPIGIANIYGGEWIWSRFWFITGLLSLVLAFMNILPIPALDGGHMIFILYEIITRKTPSVRTMEIAQMIGMLIVFALMIFAFGNDLLRLFRA